jgi:transcriptional regulator with XRE-family HTH domain
MSTNAHPELANNTRRLLGLHNMSLMQASKILGISPQALSEIQNGRRNAGLPTVQKLARFFGITLDGLLETPFEELFQQELADPARFTRVEEALRRTPIDASGSEEAR